MCAAGERRNQQLIAILICALFPRVLLFFPDNQYNIWRTEGSSAFFRLLLLRNLRIFRKCLRSSFCRASSIFWRVSLCALSCRKLISSDRSTTDQSPSSSAVSTSCLVSPFIYLDISDLASLTICSLFAIRDLLSADYSLLFRDICFPESFFEAVYFATVLFFRLASARSFSE